MTTLTVARKNGRVCLAADTLVKDGSTMIRAEYQRSDSKIIPVGDSYVGVTGLRAWDLVLRSYFESLDEVPRFESKLDVFHFLQALHAKLKDEYFLSPGTSKEFECSGLWCLIASPHGIFGVAGLRSVLEYSRFYAYGAGCDFGMGGMFVAYDRCESAVEIARAGVAAAAEFDEDTAVPIESHEIVLETSASWNGVPEFGLPELELPDVGAAKH